MKLLSAFWATWAPVGGGGVGVAPAAPPGAGAGGVVGVPGGINQGLLVPHTVPGAGLANSAGVSQETGWGGPWGGRGMLLPDPDEPPELLPPEELPPELPPLVLFTGVTTGVLDPEGVPPPDDPGDPTPT